MVASGVGNAQCNSLLCPCRHTTWSLTARVSWRPNRRCNRRARPRLPANSWSSKRPASQPLHSTSSRPPPMAVVPVRCTSANPDVDPAGVGSLRLFPRRTDLSLHADLRSFLTHKRTNKQSYAHGAAPVPTRGRWIMFNSPKHLLWSPTRGRLVNQSRYQSCSLHADSLVFFELVSFFFFLSFKYVQFVSLI